MTPWGWFLLALIVVVAWSARRIERLLERQIEATDKLQTLVKRLPFVIEHGPSSDGDPFYLEESRYWKDSIGGDAAIHLLMEKYVGGRYDRRKAAEAAAASGHNERLVARAGPADRSGNRNASAELP